MRLTGFIDYSLRVLIFLACEPGRRATIGEIAQAFQISENHLTKVVHFLGQQGWVATVRGKGGGLALAQEAATIAVGEVVRHTEGEAMPAECFDKDHNTCAIVRACRLQGVLREAAEAFQSVLDGYTLADLVHNRATLSRMLFIGRARPGARPPRATP